MHVPRKSFAFAPAHNSPPSEANPHGNDATGAFLVGLDLYRRFMERNGGTVVTCRFNNQNSRPAGIREEILDAMRIGAAGQRFDVVAYFGHGSPGGLLSAKFTGEQLDRFTDCVQETCKPSVKVLLYACSCAREGGAAFRISERLRMWVRHGMLVMGHTNAGHAFRNPNVRLYPNGGAAAGRHPAPPGRHAEWARALREPRGTLWITFPFMNDKEVGAAL